MKRSNPNPPADITGQDLIALHLRELSPSREQAVREALELDAALRLESATIAATLAAVQDPSMTVSADLLHRQWQALRPSLLAYPAPASSLPRSLPAWRLPLLATAALAGVCGVWWLIGARPAPSPVVFHHLVPGPNDRNSMLTPPTGSRAGRSGSVPGSVPGSAPGSAPNSLPGSQQPRPTRRPRLETAAVASQHDAPDPGRATSPSSPTGPPVEEATAVPSPFGGNSVSAPSDLAPATLPRVSAALKAAQNVTNCKAAPLCAKPRSSHPVDLTLALGANVTGSRRLGIEGDHGVDTFTASTSPSVSLAVHQQFRPAVGYRATLSYTRPDYTYVYQDLLSPYTTSGAVHNGILELATTYVFQGPHTKRVHTAADVGAGLMTFMPLSNTSSKFRYAPAGVLGGSAEYALSSKWRVRLGYRAQVFRTQQFEYTGGNIPVTKDLVVSHEPTLGITYQLGKAK